MNSKGETYRLLVSDTLKYVKQSLASKEAIFLEEGNRAFFETQPTGKRETAPISARVKVIPYLPIMTKRQERPQHSSLPPKKTEPPLKKMEPEPRALQEKLKTLIAKKAAHIKLSESIPDDHDAKINAALWKKSARIALLSFSQSPEELQFLKNLAKALQTSLGAAPKIVSAANIAKENKWASLFSTSSFHLVLCFTHAFDAFPEISTFLGKTPLVTLLRPYEYEKHPSLKRELWKKLSQLLQR